MIRFNSKISDEKGFSLIELLLVVIIVGLISAVAYTRLFSQSDAAAGERALESLAEKIEMRQSEAIRLNGLRAETSLETGSAPLVEIDFKNLATTGSLIINGEDGNGDHYDDYTGVRLTHLENSEWIYSFKGNALKLPASWGVVGAKEMSLRPIGSGELGRGIPTTKIGFDADGRAYGFVKGVWQKFPDDSVADDREFLPFWAVYLERPADKYMDTQAVAVAVYPSGQIEKFRFDGEVWRGWRGRIIE